MSTKITAENGAEIEVGQLGITVAHPEGTASIWARLTPEQRRALADALHPVQQVWTLSDVARSSAALAAPRAGGQWTRDDLPEWVLVSDLTGRGGDRLTPGIRDGLVAHLNAHHPKPVHPMAPEAARLRRERDTAFRDADRYRQLRNEQFARAEAAEKRLRQLESRPWGVALDDEASPVFMPAVTRAEIEKVVEEVFAREAGYGLGIDKPWPGTAPVASAVWDYLKGDDPAVYVVRESDIAAVEVERVRDEEWHANGTLVAWTGESAEDVRGQQDTARRNFIHREAVARAIEAEQAVDPVEELAAKLEEAARDAVRVTIDAMKSALGVDLPFTPDDLLSDVGPDYWRGHAREIMDGDGE